MTYKYGMRLRGAAPLCQPMKGLLYIADGETLNSRYYHNILVYSRELKEKELREYELDYLGEIAVESQN